ncbi:hypothetical protein SVI_4319 [Shewanella violacea DSS12]|uniref:Uncharacterized protein n=1 Tax=Shewanella violacea (strain JCM 10179 / CIP 106290 / LMG 19151 / DSS12) TaxID=637905 RepID=D4ZFC6_SHEVD|nr:hypothetical protein SVI_4319 [Shewanella violacea DSS12]
MLLFNQETGLLLVTSIGELVTIIKQLVTRDA